MTAHKASIRVARSQRMIAELGHTDILDALAHAEEMRTALRVIHTWAGVPGALDARHVRELTAKALHMPSSPSLDLTAAARAAQPKEHEMTDAESRPAAVGQVERRVRPLPKTQADLLEALRKGVTLCYMPYMGGFNPTAYYFRDDNHQRVTAAAAALLSKGLVEKYEVTRRGHRVRAKAPPAA